MVDFIFAMQGGKVAIFAGVPGQMKMRQTLWKNSRT